MSRIRALIVDDEPLARDRLRGLLAAEPTVDLIGECSTGPETLAAIRVVGPDVVFLDLHLPGCDGRQVAAQLPEARRPAIVFATADAEAEFMAAGHAAVDCLFKPFDRERFQQALRRVEQYLKTRADLPAPGAKVERLAVKAADRVVSLGADEIVHFEAGDNLVTVHLVDGQLVVDETLGALEFRLGTGSFVRVNRTAIVNVDQIREIIVDRRNESVVVLRDGTRLPLERGQRVQSGSNAGA